ncbi:ER membrane protein complex subunit 7 homolog [Drosophila eugracilis]|uniref:ER membrane protein complex subunit 7 homolog n=1 Tax=Drosophila eugracilis TaxID=29029 RepID=UPI001BD9BE56|nr:ER membrane protein complex subunit 7 homolog [Drosophila eugracilis]
MFKIIVILLIGSLGSGLGSHELVPRKVEEPARALYSIKGVILKPDSSLNLKKSWMSDITLSINNGEFKGFVRLDRRFLILGVPNGSHILEVEHPDIYFQPVKVEITAKGKYRARKVNYIQPSTINQVAYPLRLLPHYRKGFFRTRQEWQIIDIVLSPIVLIMLVPLVLMLVVPKLIKDPEAKKELDNIQFPKMNDMPDLSDMLSTFLSGKKPERSQSGRKKLLEKSHKKYK